MTREAVETVRSLYRVVFFAEKIPHKARLTALAARGAASLQLLDTILHVIFKIRTRFRTGCTGRWFGRRGTGRAVGATAVDLRFVLVLDAVGTRRAGSPGVDTRFALVLDAVGTIRWIDADAVARTAITWT